MAGEVSFQLTEADCVAAYRDMLRDRFSGRNSFLGFVLTFLVVIVALLTWGHYAKWAGPSGFGQQTSAVLLSCVALLWLYRLGVYFAISLGARRRFRKSPILQRPLRYSWSEAGLGFRNADDSGHVPWSDLHRWHAAKYGFLFFTGERLAYFIPRSALSDIEAEDLEATLVASGAPGTPRLEDRLIYA
jgi:hypothetical protein